MAHYNFQSSISLDWLTLYCVPEIHVMEANKNIFKVVDMGRGTRQMAIWEELYFEGNRIATITRQPLSNILPPDAHLIKFDNSFLYGGNLYQNIIEVLKNLKLKFKSISRMDIAMDYTKHSNGWLPAKMVEKVMCGEILKIGKQSFSAHGQNNSALSFNGMKFGKADSPVSAYCYNKSLEMNQVKRKPWIEQKWIDENLNIHVDVWRLEFSVKASNIQFCDTDTAELLNLNNITTLKASNLNAIFLALRAKYWNFVKCSGDSNKSRRPRIQLFAKAHTSVVTYMRNLSSESNRTEKILIHKLCDLYQEMREVSPLLADDIRSAQYAMHQKYDLLDWSIRKGYNITGEGINESTDSLASARAGIVAQNIKAEKIKQSYQPF
jgi:hypothetical protein